MDIWLKRYCKGLEVITVICLALMVTLVLGNVVLRYVFNSGIAVAEEVSRWLFVWVTFLGGTVALLERGHLGTEMLVGRLGPQGKKVCLALGYLLMLFVCGVLFLGSLEQTRINLEVTAPSSGASLAIFYAVGIVFSVSAAVILGNELFKLLTGRLTERDLVIVKESEDQR